MEAFSAVFKDRVMYVSTKLYREALVEAVKVRVCARCLCVCSHILHSR